MLEERSVMLVKEESQYGTDPTPLASANAILAIGAKIKEVSEPIERPVQTASLSRNASVLGSIYCEVSFSVEMRGSGTKGTAARIGDLLEACGMAESVSVGSSVSYKPSSASIKSVTIYLYKDGRRHVVTGARGSMKLKAQANKAASLEFNMKGLYAAPTDTAIPTDAVYETTVPPVIKNASATLNSVTTLLFSSSELDMAAEVIANVSKNSATGIGAVTITGRKPTLTLDPEAVAVSTLDLRALLCATPVAYSEVIGSVAGNKITVSVPKYNITDIEGSDRDGVMVDTLKGECCRNSDAGNDEFEIKFE